MDLEINQYNNTYLQIKTSRAIEQELGDYYSFDVPNAAIIARKKKMKWDGKIKLFQSKQKMLPFGLLENLIKFCEDRKYSYQLNATHRFECSEVELREFIAELQFPNHIEARDYQFETILSCIRRKRLLVLSPTASGKSYMIYVLAHFYAQYSKTLIIVPQVNLVNQMESDFLEYNCPENLIGSIKSGNDKVSSPITISTWQSLNQIDPKFLNEFDCVIVDEAHGANANVLKNIVMQSNAAHKFGFTGTITDSVCNKMMLEGTFGPVFKITSTYKLIQQGVVADPLIKVLVLNYPEDLRKLFHKHVKTYADESRFLAELGSRNRFIVNLAMSLKGNTVILTRLIDTHAKKLYEMLKERGANPYIIIGEVDDEEREEVRQELRGVDNAIIVAGYQAFGTGTNIPNINNLILASSTKSKVRNLQGIGRALRTTSVKKTAEIFDIADNLEYRSRKNFTIEHLNDRITNYANEQFKFKIHNIEIGVQPMDSQADN